jgi:hypothetical protein
MSTPYSGASAAGPPQGYAEPTQQNYAADYSGSMGTPTTEAGRPDVEGTSVGQLMGEVKAEAKKAGAGAGLFGAAGFAGYMVLMFLSIALWWALSHLVGHSWSALIVAVLWGIVGAVAYTMGRKKFQQVNPKPERTVETLQQVPGALKPN